MGLAIVAAIALFAVAYPWFSHQSPFEPDFVNGRAPYGVPAGPSRFHPLGTDTIFRDLLVRLAYGGRLSLEVASIATAIAMVLGTGVGVVSGFFKGTRVRIDAVLDLVAATLLLVSGIGWILHATTTSGRFAGGAGWLFALALVLRAPFAVRRRPSGRDLLDVAGALGVVAAIVRFRADVFDDRRILVAVVAVGLVSSFLGLREARDESSRHLRIDLDDATMRVVDVLLSFPFLLLLMALSAAVDRTTETTIFLVLGLTGWTGTARVIRGKTLQIRELEFVTASRALGQSTPRMLMNHILPNVIGVAIVLATNSVAGMIVAEAALSFLGLSVPAPAASWGRMLDEGRPYAQLAPWLLVGPAVAILLAVLGFNLLGDGLRDAFDPKDA